MRRVIASSLGVLMLATALFPAAAGAGADAKPSAEEVTIYLPTGRERSRHQLTIRLLPQRGIALVSTYEGEEATEEAFREDSYAIAIPRKPLAGSIDVHFPGLGEIVGSVVPEGGSGSEGVTFDGKIRFRDAGRHEPWSASEAEVQIGPETRRLPRGKTRSAELFNVLAENGGPVLPGPASFRFFAHGPPGRRVVEFIAFGDDRPRSGGAFAAVDLEWLPGEVAARRVASRSTAFPSRIATDAVEGRPNKVVFKPPAPFFGSATYLERTGKLRGSLGVRFSGLSLRLAHPPLPATLEDEDLR
jgi:hypothetical protein